MAVINATVNHADILKAQAAEHAELARRFAANRAWRKKLKSKNIKHELPKEIRYGSDGTELLVRSRTTTKRTENCKWTSIR